MKTKKELNLYPFYDLQGMEDHLHDMAGKGWFLHKPGTLLWEYEKGEPADVKYGVCWSGEAEAYDPRAGEPHSFKERAKLAGWSPAVITDRLQAYRTEPDNQKALSVSPFDRIFGVQQAAKPNLFLYGTLVFLGILSILLFAFKMHVMPVAALAGSFTIVIPLVLTLIGIYFAADMILYAVLKNKADVAAAEKKFFSCRTPMAKILFWILTVSAVLLGLGAVTGGRSPMLGVFFVCLVVVLGLLLIMKVLRGAARGKSRTLTAALDILLAVILAVGVTLSVTRINRADAGYNGELPVTAQELGYEGDPQNLQDYSRSKSSGLLRYTEASQMEIQEDGSYVPLLSYEMVESRAIPVDGMVLDHYLSRMSASARKDENGEILPVKYEPVDASLWKAEKAWQLTDGTMKFDVYLLLYDDILVELGVPEALTEDQMAVFGTEIQK